MEKSKAQDLSMKINELMGKIISTFTFRNNREYKLVRMTQDIFHAVKTGFIKEDQEGLSLSPVTEVHRKMIQRIAKEESVPVKEKLRG